MIIKPIIFLLMIFLSNPSFGQQNVNRIDEMNYVNGKSIYLHIDQKNININHLSRSNVKNLLGIPKAAKTIENETSDAKNVKEYRYVNGTITFEDYQLADLNISKASWAITFINDNGFTKPLSIGSKVADLKKAFPYSWIHRDRNIVRVGIKASDGSITDAFIVFTIKNGHITKIHLFVDES